MKRKAVLFLSLVVLGTSILSGCGGNSAEQSAESTTGAKTKLVFLRVGTELDRKEYWTETVEGFMEENPDIEIEYQECPSGDDFETKLNTGFASGTAPDVICFTMASMGTRVPLGQYAELDSYMEGWEGKEDIMENSLKLGQINGKTYGIPVFPDPRIFIYNKEMFEEAGLDPDSPPTTWDELLEYHKMFVQKEGDTVVQTGFGMPTSGDSMQHMFSIFIEENGVKNIVDEDTNEILCNTPEAVEATEFMETIKDEGIIPWDYTSSEQNPFATGLAAMTIGTDSDFRKWNSEGLKGKIAMAAPLSNTQQATFCGMQFLFMNGETEYDEEAWKFIEYASSKESMWKRYEDLGTTPVRESLREQFIAEDPETNEVIFESINCGTGSPKVPYANSVYNIINEAMEKVMYDVASPQEALDTAAQKIQEEIDNQ